MANGYIRPSDLGPSFIMEIPKSVITREGFKQAYQESFMKYNYRNYDPLEDIDDFLEHLWNSFDQDGFAGFTFNHGIFNTHKFKDMDGSFWKMPIKNPNQFQKEFYKFIPNDLDYDYILIEIEKRDKDEIFICTPERWAAFYEILKIWIKTLTPHYVWGDWFKTLKEEGETDSRLNVWGYQYYSRKFVDAIGKEPFDELVKEDTVWNLEQFNDGLILCGNPHPCSITKRSKTKAKRILRLDERLEAVIKKKIPIQPEIKERPPEGVIE